MPAYKHYSASAVLTPCSSRASLAPCSGHRALGTTQELGSPSSRGLAMLLAANRRDEPWQGLPKTICALPARPPTDSSPSAKSGWPPASSSLMRKRRTWPSRERWQEGVLQTDGARAPSRASDAPRPQRPASAANGQRRACRAAEQRATASVGSWRRHDRSIEPGSGLTRRLPALSPALPYRHPCGSDKARLTVVRDRTFCACGRSPRHGGRST
jgi:hypothetical protein